MIEFKAVSLKTSERLCPAADEILKNYKGKYFIQSFFPFVLYWYRKKRKDIIRGQLASWYGKGEPIHMKLLGKLCYNFISRPDFVSYDYQYANKLGRRICVLLGAHSAGWTFKSEEAVKASSTVFSTRIFENFLPQTNEKR